MKTALGAEVRVRKMSLSLFSGVDMAGVAVANPAPFAGDLVTADSFVFRYRLLPLLAGRIAVDQLVLERPTLALAMDARGGFNYERLGGRTAGSVNAHGASVPLAIDLSRLAVEHGRLTVVDARRASLLSVENADFTTSLQAGPDGYRGRGRLGLGKIVLASGVAVTDLTAPLEIAGGVARVGPLRGHLAKGDVGGELRIDLARARFTSDVELRGIDVAALAREAGSIPGFDGELRAKASVAGAGGVATLKGKGEAQIDRCRAAQSRLFETIAAALQAPALRHPDLDECRVTFTLGGGRLETPVVSAKGASLALTGAGGVDLASTVLDYKMTLALSSQLLARVPVADLRAAFRERGDGFSTLDFAVTGTTAAPKTDIALRIAKGAAGGRLKKLFDKLR